ncbi:MAG: DNA polymerase II [bacterium]|jgi:DNA polymerase elongation subunit (family B)
MTERNGEILYGWNDTERVVAFSSHESDGRQVLRMYIRDGGSVSNKDVIFRPFLIAAHEEMTAVLDGAEISTLSGNLDYRYKAEFATFKELERAKKAIDAKFKGSFKRVTEEYLYLSDPVQQGLVCTGATHFRGMTEDDVVRMQLDIETDTTEGYEFPNAERACDEIILIALSMSGGRELVLSRRDLSESEMLIRLGEIVREWDPDVIEGHNIFRFDLPYIETRAKRHKIKLAWGRDGSIVASHKSRLNLAERRFDYVKYEVAGRAFVDTYILVQFYDLVKREMESYGLKEVAKYLGIAGEDRTYVEGSEIRTIWRSDPDRLIEYALDDVRETAAISAMLGAPYFYQAQMLPFAYQDIFVRGNAMKINGLMLREYLRRGHSMPRPFKGQIEVTGGLTELKKTGLIKDVVLCDAASLYPSLMISYGIAPESDELGAFLAMLTELRERRLLAKAAQKKAENPSEKRRLENQQATFKILINSFFGYLGAEGAYFGDGSAANRVTGAGQEILRKMMERLEAEGCSIIEVDTDGIYFNPPREGMSDEEVEAIIGRLESTLPEGISVDIEGRYPVMLSYKVKNYALLRRDGTVIIKGSGMKSRGLEPFQRDFLADSIRLILQEKMDEVEALYANLKKSIAEMTIPVARLAKTERLQEPLSAYKEKTAASGRGRQAGYELAIASGREFGPGDYVTYYVTGDKPGAVVWKSAKLLSEYDPENPDVNVAYYLSKLDELYKRVKGFVSS